MLNRAVRARIYNLERRRRIHRHVDIDAIASALSDDDLAYAIERLKGVEPDADREERFVQLVEKYSSLMRTQ